MEVQPHLFVTSVLNIGEWSASLPGPFIRRKRVLNIHQAGHWVGHRVSLSFEEKNLLSLLGFND
jgi:hypothetical protein